MATGLPRLFQKRIQNELKLLQKDPLESVDIFPDESDIRTWYFLIRGPDDSDYKGGWYIGKLVLSENYPTTPVDFYMLTPNGRFDIEKKICLTISSYHSDQWSSIWSIQKILGAFLSVMVSDFDTGISHIKKTPLERKALAESSLSYNISIHPNILKNFKRFVKYENDNYVMKTLEEIQAEMPKPKEKKKKDKEEDKVDLSMLKITDS
jgi:ubiquitin-protein ligase